MIEDHCGRAGMQSALKQSANNDEASLSRRWRCNESRHAPREGRNSLSQNYAPETNSDLDVALFILEVKQNWLRYASRELGRADWSIVAAQSPAEPSRAVASRRAQTMAGGTGVSLRADQSVTFHRRYTSQRTGKLPVRSHHDRASARESQW